MITKSKESEAKDVKEPEQNNAHIVSLPFLKAQVNNFAKLHDSFQMDKMVEN